MADLNVEEAAVPTTFAHARALGPTPAELKAIALPVGTQLT
jgi:hypothetical protein